MEMGLITSEMVTKAISILILSTVFYFEIFSYVVAFEDGLVKMMRSQVLIEDIDSDENIVVLEFNLQPLAPPINLYHDLGILPTYEDSHNYNYPNIPSSAGPFGNPPPPYSPASNVQ